MVDYG
jgi:hypothetical protein